MILLKVWWTYLTYSSLSRWEDVKAFWEDFIMTAKVVHAVPLFFLAVKATKTTSLPKNPVPGYVIQNPGNPGFLSQKEFQKIHLCTLEILVKWKRRLDTVEQPGPCTFLTRKRKRASSFITADVEETLTSKFAEYLLFILQTLQVILASRKLDLGNCEKR